MPELTFAIEPHPEDSYVRIRVRGRLTAPETRQTRARVIADHPGLHRLWDFLEADLTAWSGDDMRMFIEVIARSEPGDPTTRVAALVSREVDYGQARMFESLSCGTLPEQGKVFRNESEAIRWVSIGAERRPADD